MNLTTDLERLLEAHLRANFPSVRLRTISQIFRRNGMVKLPDLIPAPLPPRSCRRQRRSF